MPRARNSAKRAAWASSDGQGVSQTSSHGPGERCRVELPRGRIGAVDSGLDEVPVVVEPGGDTAGARGQAEVVEPAQLDQPAPALDDPAGRFGIVEDLVEQRAPAFLEGELALELVEHPESGRQTGLHGIVVQDPAGEGVQRADRGVVEGVEREVHPLGVDRVVGIGLCRDQLGAQAMAQLGGGLLGERDGGDRADLDTARHERHDPADQAAGLARTGPRLDEQVGVEIGGDRQPVGAIGQRVVLAHDASPWSNSADSSWGNHGARRGSSCLSCHSPNRSATPSPSGWQ